MSLGREVTGVAHSEWCKEEGEREGKEEGERGRVTYCGMWNSPVTTLLSVLFTPSVWRERGRGRVK